MTSEGKEDPTQEGGEYRLWGSRFERPLSEEAEALNRSLPIDRRLWREEIEVDIAWSRALAEAGVLSRPDAEELVRGLTRIGSRLERSGIGVEEPDEDVHTLVERLLAGEVGEQVAGRLRTGRSRNDQTATLTRLWALRSAARLDSDILGLGSALLDRAESSVNVLVPAYTHLQRAQPVRLAHFFLAHLWPLARDRRRWEAARRSASVLPLGSGAVAGSGFPVDRAALARTLGFEEVAPNSMDAVSDRDFVAEFAFAGALTGIHLSRLAEDLILFASAEFGFVRFDDAYSTGSSLMPQKRNPDIAELARGKSGRLVGELMTALTLLKGLPAGYNKDLQEDKAVLFSVFDTLSGVLPALAGAVGTLAVDERAAARALEPAMLAVDLADGLVRAGLPFSAAHSAVGSLVRTAEARGISMFELPRRDVEKIHPELPTLLASLAGDDRYESSVEARAASGGTARRRVLEQIEAARTALGDTG